MEKAKSVNIKCMDCGALRATTPNAASRTKRCHQCQHNSNYRKIQERKKNAK
jgi:hypothetical protein